MSRREVGFSLVELMIAMLIGLFIVLGVVLVYASAVRTQVLNESLSRVQENGRFAVSFLSRDIRMAGFSGGCPKAPKVLLDVDATNANYDLLSLDQSVMGWDNSSGPHSAFLTGYQAGTDVISLQYGASGRTLIARNNQSHETSLNVTTATDVPKDSVVLVTDYQSCDLFRNRSASNATTLNRAPGSPNPSPPNKSPASSNPYSTAYNGEIFVSIFESVIYYIGTGANGRPALRRVRFSQGIGASNASEELVSDIADMQIEYGVDADRDRDPENFVNAGAVGDWGDVIAVRLWLLTEGQNGNVLETPQQLPAPFNGLDVSDRRLRRVFTATSAIRNRLP
ncbi:PilW family protein [Marinobacterium litorale]|uniref:PilW family protein n=1 Tax=Marinobacterium litorale TaxID=404770 RepID=UPI0003FC9A97|nr:PilW family protein [Marinobacterium litorale]